jgi:hypothetical protein
MATRATFLVLAMGLLAGCNSYHLRYPAVPQPSGARIFADYTLLQDAVGVSVDTDGRRLEGIYVKKPEGVLVRPVNIVYPAFAASGAVGTGVGFGSGHVGVGTGVFAPVGPERAQGLTTATFGAAALGPPPWALHVKVEGITEAVVPGFGGVAGK